MNLHLTLEQKFRLKILTEQAQSLPREEAIKMLVELIRQDMVKTNALKSMAKDVL